MKKLYIHIGANKTGTTSIQSALAKSESDMNERDFSYPYHGRIWNGHFKLAWALGAGGTEQQKKESLGSWEELASFMKNSPYNNFVLSSENFILVNKESTVEYINSLFSGFAELSVIFYIRRQDFWVESLYLQAVKMGVAKSGFSSFVKKPGQRLNFLQILQPWESVLGKESMIVKSYDEDKGCLLGSFLSSIGLQGLDVSGEDKLNPSLSRSCAEIILDNYGENFSGKDIAQISDFWNKNVEPMLVNNLELSDRFFTKKERVEFLRSFEESNRVVAEKYFDRCDLFDLSAIPDGLPCVSEEAKNYIYKMYFLASLRNIVS